MMGTLSGFSRFEACPARPWVAAALLVLLPWGHLAQAAIMRLSLTASTISSGFGSTDPGRLPFAAGCSGANDRISPEALIGFCAAIVLSPPE
jgi:hypothetical protein